MGCNRNAIVDHAADDLMYLQNLAVLASKTRLAGTVRQYDDIPGKGFGFVRNLAGIKISITDARGKAYETFTDNNGVYEVVGLPPGAYQVRADIPDTLKLETWQEKQGSVKLVVGSCAAADFVARSDARISGRVIDVSGRTRAR